MNNKLLGSAPLFFVSDIHRSVDYYCSVLGFENTGLWGEPPFFSMPRRDYMIVMLQETESKQINNMHCSTRQKSCFIKDSLNINTLIQLLIHVCTSKI